jgi:hypothetical protein
MAVITSTPAGRSNGGRQQAFVKDQAEAEEIAARVHGFAAHLFRRHVPRRASTLTAAARTSSAR